MSQKPPTKIIHEGTWTPYPNELIERAMPAVKPTAFLILTVIARKTAGFHVLRAKIAIGYFRVTTGIASNTTIYEGLAELESEGFITIHKPGKPGVASEYSLNIPEATLTECVKDTLTDSVNSKETKRKGKVDIPFIFPQDFETAAERAAWRV